MTTNSAVRHPSGAASSASSPVGVAQPRLVDLMSDGFHLLLLMQRGQLPKDKDQFSNSVKKFFVRVTSDALAQGIGLEDVETAKYAFCTTVDELILASPCTDFRSQWQLRPLQLDIFNSQVGGDEFFMRLEQLRAQGKSRLHALEVYHLCLLLGFQGKFAIEGDEKLEAITARLLDEITFLKGKRTSFSPHWAAPDKIRHSLRRYIPIWLPAMVIGAVGLASYSGLRLSLNAHTQQQLSGYHDVVNMPSRTAHLKITLP